MGKRLFVSYSRADTDAVAELVDDLKNFGHTAWMDRELTGGQRWWDEVLRNIRECDVLVFALSEEARTSKACMSEFNYAVALHRPVLPVVVRAGFSESLLPESLGDVQRVDYTKPDRLTLSQLIKSVELMPSAPDLPDPLPQPPAVPATYMFDLSKEIESPEKIAPEKQDQLVMQLRHQATDGGDSQAILTLIERFRQRDERTVPIDAELAKLEAEVAKGAPGRPRRAQQEEPREEPPEAPQPVAPTPPKEPEKEGKSVFYWIGVVVVVLIILAILAGEGTY